MRHSRLSVFAAALLVGAASPGLADPPPWAGGGKHGGGQGQQHKKAARAERAGFSSDDRHAIHEYYGKKARSGRCPPGLAKKNNGCMPPGQAKKWAKGQPLPADVRYYPLPPDLRIHLPPPPPDHRYVRIANDVLLIAIGSRMVIDAVEDIFR